MDLNGQCQEIYLLVGVASPLVSSEPVQLLPEKPHLSKMSKVHSEHEGISVARLPTKSENLQTQRLLSKIEKISQKLMT